MSLRLASVLAVTICVVCSVQARPLDPLPPNEVENRLQELTQASWVTGSASEKDNGWLSNCRRSIVTVNVGDPITGQSRAQNLTVVRPAKSRDPVPVVIVVPTMEGVTPIETSIASQLCDINMATIIADVDDNTVPQVIPSWGLEDARNRYAILALRTTIDYAHNTSYFDSNKVGLMGLSLGAVMTSFIAGIEADRLSALVIVLGGGDIPYILSVSDNDRVKTLRDLRMKSENMASAEQYEEKLRQTMRYDPMYFAAGAHPEKMLMVMSSADTKVPTPMQQDLYNAFGQPTNSVYKSGHVQTIVALTYFYFNTVTTFLQDKFGIKHAPLAPELLQAQAN